MKFDIYYMLGPTGFLIALAEREESVQFLAESYPNDIIFGARLDQSVNDVEWSQLKEEVSS